jgi:hypothetical protein
MASLPPYPRRKDLNCPTSPTSGKANIMLWCAYYYTDAGLDPKNQLAYMAIKFLLQKEVKKV